MVACLRHCGDIAAPGEQLGVRCLAQGSHLSRGHFLPDPGFEPTILGYLRFQVKFKVKIFGHKVRHASSSQAHSKARAALSPVEFFCSVRLNAWEAKATGRSMPSWSCDRTASAAVAEASHVTNVGQSILNCSKKGGLVNSSLSVRTTSEKAKDQVHGASFLSSWQRGYVIVEYWGRKHI